MPLKQRKLKLRTASGQSLSEEDLPRILIDAYDRAALGEHQLSALPADRYSQIYFGDLDTAHWPRDLKLSLMTAAQAHWLPSSGMQSSCWSPGDPGARTATALFQDHPGLVRALAGQDAHLLAWWRRDHPHDETLNPLDRYQDDLLLNLAIQTIVERHTEERLWNDLSRPAIPADEACRLSPSLRDAVAQAASAKPISEGLHDRILTELEDLAHSVADAVPTRERARLARRALEAQDPATNA